MDEHNAQLRIDLQSHRLWLAEEEIHLTRLEFEILECLVNRLGQIVTYQELWRSVWKCSNPIQEDDYTAMRQAIKRLRRKLREDWQKPKFIFCKWGIGFRLSEDAVGIID
ncbi:response regulator transcription factor [Anaerolineae bacterium CFX7]|nr:response regulator transcription factor [Anaerolineae bacterium CFX7]